MSLDNSTIQHPLPGDLQARVENALNLVTGLEAEENRLSKLIGSMKSEVNSLHEEKKSLESAISGLKDQKRQAEKEMAETDEALTELNNLIVAAKNSLGELKVEAESVAKKTDEDKSANLERIKRVEQTETEINRRRAELSKKETEHEARVRRILEAVK